MTGKRKVGIVEDECIPVEELHEVPVTTEGEQTTIPGLPLVQVSDSEEERMTIPNAPVSYPDDKTSSKDDEVLPPWEKEPPLTRRYTKKSENTVPETVPETTSTPTPFSTQEKEDSSSRKKSWGEVMVLERINLPVNTSGTEKVEGYIPLDVFDLETGSTAEAEKWLTEMVEKGKVPYGTFTIIRKVKTIRIKEVRQVITEEIDG